MSSSYLIVGAGVFGASTALHLIRKYPDASITLVDRNAYTAATRVAASWDWNKVVRADYKDIVYTRMALEAQQVWRNDPMLKPFYHESGAVWISPGEFATQVLNNYKELGVQADLKTIPVEEARKLYGGLFDDSDYSGIKEVLVNKTSGWAEAKEALQAVIEKAFELGVKYLEAEVTSLAFEDSSSLACTGIKTEDGQSLTAEKIILSTGAYTPKLLTSSAPDRKELHAGDRILASGVTEAMSPLNEQQAKAFLDMPVAVQFNPPGRGYDFGCLPLPKDQALKYWGQIIFRNTLEHPVTREQMSMPPPKPDYAQWDVPEALKDDVRLAPKSTFGSKGADLEFKNFRICWDAFTPTEDFMISPHSASKNLFIATCGSFHGFKFLPVLGKYVVEMLDGTLNSALARKWAWDQDLPATEHNAKWPKTELRDYIGK